MFFQFAGQVIHAVSGGKVLPYAEERPGFQIPDKYKPGYQSEKKQTRRPSPGEERASEETVTGRSDDQEEQNQEGDEEGGKKGKGENGEIIVDWYGPEDPENPQNWYVPQLFPTYDLLTRIGL